MIPFFNQTWVSNEARDYWQPKLKELSEFWQRMERLSVIYELRNLAIQFTAPEGLGEVQQYCLDNGLNYINLVFDGKRHRIGIYKQGNVDPQRLITLEDEYTGKVLGYPICCIRKFGYAWNMLKHRDTMLDMIEWPTNSNEVYIQESPSTNILLRDLGIRPVFHLPCSFHCQATKDIAHKIVCLAYDLGHRNEIDDIYSILRWPVKFSSLHGIAEITTPVMKFRRDTDEDFYERSICYMGKVYPHLSSSGTKFPFQKNRPLLKIGPTLADQWSDNGFESRTAMDRGHQLILQCIEAGIERDREFSVIDLGCGNGQLLGEIKAKYPNVTVTGVDNSVEKIERAKHNVPGLFGKVADVTRMEFDQTYDLGIISENRIDEANRSGIEHFQAKLERFCKKLCIYSYEKMTCSIQ